MAGYIPLEALLAPYWEADFSELPKELQERVRVEFFPFTWDSLSFRHRREYVQQHDFLRDPTNEKLNEHYFNLGAELADLTRQRHRLELMNIVSPLELESQQRQLAAIDARESAINAELAPQFATPVGETTKQRNDRLKKRRKELRAAGSTNPTKTLAQEFEISESLVRRILRGPKAKAKIVRGIFR